MPNKFIAEVIDNNDPLKQGRCQIYIAHLMENWNPDHYPWAYPNRDWSSNIPEIGDKIWIFFEEEEFLKKPFYQNKVQFIDENDANETIGSMTGAYPDIKYIQLKNGVSIGLNSDETEISILAGNAEIFIDKNGKVNINGNTKQFVTWTELNTALQAMVSAANSLYLTSADNGVAGGGLTLDISGAKTTTVLTGG